jgi:methionyl aminopeptidase
LTLGSPKIKMDPDGWTVRTADGSLASHSEHTILITKNGPEVLTLLKK